MHLAYALPMTGRAHGAGRRNGQDMKWLQEVRRMGTTADKVAAMTLLLQESAVSNLRSLDELLRLGLQAQRRARGCGPGAPSLLLPCTLAAGRRGAFP